MRLNCDRVVLGFSCCLSGKLKAAGITKLLVTKAAENAKAILLDCKCWIPNLAHIKM